MLREVLHRIDEAQRGGAVAGIEPTRDDGARPAADPGKDGDVLLAVGAAIDRGWPTIPEPTLKRQSSSPVSACTALNQPSMVP